MTAVDALVPEPDRVDLEPAALRAWLADRYALPGDAWLRVNLVSALGGQTAGPSGGSDDLSGGIDRILLGVLRRAADVVLVGAGTVRAESLTMPRHTALAIATGGGALPVDRVPAPVDGRRAVVLCPDAVAPHLREQLGGRAEVVAAGDPLREPASLVRALAERGLGRVVCEGGGRLAGALLAAGAVDELDQTVAPIATAPGPAAIDGDVPPTPARLVGLLRDGTDRLYARWSFTRP